MTTNRKVLIGLAVAMAVAAALLVRSCGRGAPSVPVPSVSGPSVIESSGPVAVSVLPPAPAPTAPPVIQIHKELIPKNIEIVRVYYASMITGPASTIQFDINGSGFTKGFEKMITVESGQPNATVKNLSLVTPNQIHGTLEISAKSATMVAFLRVLIQGKVVFQAPEPFAVIRPGDVLNLIFTEMGESGRSGRFRVFTNLTPEMFSNFNVGVSTPSIQISNLTPTLPFLVDGAINIGSAVGGNYDIDVVLKGKSIWNRKGIIRVVRPNVGESGLIQKVLTLDGFHRPGDTAKFALHGSGFQPGDVNLLKASVPDLGGVASSFTFVSPGRLELSLVIPSTAPVKAYGLKIAAGEEILQNLSNAFRVVDRDWTRLLKVDPRLLPGGKSTLTIVGRDLSEATIAKIKVEVDEPDLSIGAFFLMNPQEASAPISAGPSVKPGDYLLKITSDGKPVSPEFGSIIRVSN